MVFVKDFRKEFYEIVQNQRVLVLVSFDVDALCACKILQYLFQCDQVLYTIVPVAGQQDLERAFMENSEGVQYVLLINCGGCLDVVELLQPEDHIVFFICDSHRPIDLSNVFNQVQVQLLMKHEEFDEIPNFREVFREEEESDQDQSGNESDDSERSGKRRRFNEEVIEKRRERRLWEEKRETYRDGYRMLSQLLSVLLTQIIFEYTEFSGYGTSAAMLMFDMAWKMSKDSNDLLWFAIIGATEQFMNNKIERDKYIEYVGQLQSHVSRLNHRPTDDEERTISVDCLRISFDTELHLTLYRHWSLFESLCHSEYSACKFKVWTMKGKKRLHEFLADMGLPLVQCRQKYASMDSTFREGIKDGITKYIAKYSINEQDIFLPSFHAQYGYKNKYCAGDFVHASEALLESVETEHSASDNFLRASDVLTRTNTECMQKGLEIAKTQLRAVANQVQSFLDMNQIISAGPFLYAFVQEGTPDMKFFSKPTCLCRLAKFTLEAYCSVARNKRARTLPLVLGAPLDAEKGTMLVIGIPPASDTRKKNCLGKAFEQAATTTNSRTLHDNFDSHIMEMKTEDKSKFFDALISLLQ